MKIAVLGTGVVGETIGARFCELGHDVMMGSRTSNNEKALKWKAKTGANANVGAFAEAAQFGEIIFNCTAGMGSLEALDLAGAENLAGKILIDVSNPLDFSKGMPPTLSVSNTDSLAEQIQRAFPDTKVVKTLNTVNAYIMVNPSLLAAEHDMFICGNDNSAKSKVNEILRQSFGWKTVIDLGDITGARTMEMLLPIWVRLYGILGTPNFNFHIVK
jgi:8-hydroxy-5-deazaflavin:NADPH oxidoreductase